MKLSQAIENAIRTGKYNLYNEFMCHVLKDNYSVELMEELQRMLNIIFPGIRTRPLITTLHKIEENKPGFDSVLFWATSFERTKEWYCWFVFDLKRKGL